MSTQDTISPPVVDPHEKVKTWTVYGTAAIVVVGGMVLIGAMMLIGIIQPDIGVPSLTLVIGGAVQFLFAEAQSRRTESTMERANIVARSTVGQEKKAS